MIQRLAESLTARLIAAIRSASGSITGRWRWLGLRSSPPGSHRRTTTRPRRRGRLEMAGVSDQAGAGSPARSSRRSPAARSMRPCGCCRKAERAAMFAIYAFCRAVDDIADEPGRRPRRAREADSTPGAPTSPASMPAGRRGAWASWSRRAALGPGAGRLPRPSSTAWRWTWTRTSARRPRRRSTSTATGSPARSAGCRSRSSAWSDEPGVELAHHLGRALQLTNILRDLDEDAGIGRLYLPREALDEAGIASDDPQAVIADPRVDARLPRSWPSCARALPRGRRGAGPAARRPPARAAADERGLRQHPGQDGGRGLGAAARSAPRSARPRCSGSCCRTA